jgi:hypothetical protein
VKKKICFAVGKFTAQIFKRQLAGQLLQEEVCGMIGFTVLISLKNISNRSKKTLVDCT